MSMTEGKSWVIREEFKMCLLWYRSSRGWVVAAPGRATEEDSVQEDVVVLGPKEFVVLVEADGMDSEEDGPEEVEILDSPATLGLVEVVALVSIRETESSLSATGDAGTDKSGTSESTEEAIDSGGLVVAGVYLEYVKCGSS